MITLKIIKISEGVFKHVITKEDLENYVFYNTKATKLAVNANVFNISYGWGEGYFKTTEIQVYDINEVLQVTPDMASLVNVLAALKYPPLLDAKSSLLDSSSSQALTDSQLRASDVPVSTPLPELPITGQGKIATTGTAVQMPNKVLKNGIVIKSSPDNLSPLFIGTSDVTTVNDGTGNGYKLDPGEAISFAIKNTNTIYVNGTAGSVYYYSGN